MTQIKPLRIAVLISGSGTTLENLFEKVAEKTLPAEVVLVVSSRSDAFGLERAKRRNVPTAVVERKAFKSAFDFSRGVFEALSAAKPDLIVMAGFMSMVLIPAEYEHRVINVHPALLPAFGGKGFYGNRVHEAVIAEGCKIAGCTVHFVDNEYDRGAIIAQRAIEVLDSDTSETLGNKVQATERELYPEVIRWIAEGRVKVEGRRVKVS